MSRLNFFKKGSPSMTRKLERYSGVNSNSPSKSVILKRSFMTFWVIGASRNRPSINSIEPGNFGISSRFTLSTLMRRLLSIKLSDAPESIIAEKVFLEFKNGNRILVKTCSLEVGEGLSAGDEALL